MNVILNGDNNWEEIILNRDKAKEGKHKEGGKRSDKLKICFSSVPTTTLK